MLYVIARVKDQVILEKTDIEPPADEKLYLEAVVKNYGEKPEDYHVMTMESGAPTAKKIISAFFFDAVWKDDRIIDVDFSKYTANPRPATVSE